MNVTQIAFVALPTVARAEQWRAHHLGVLDGAAAHTWSPTPGTKVVWQLTSANHRTLGRSIRVFDDFESAYEDAANVQAHASELVVRHTKLAGQLGYGWTAALHGDPVIMCSRAYSTVRDNRDSSTVALAAIAYARLGSAPRARTVTGRRV